MLTQEQKEQHIQVCQCEHDCFLHHVITSDETQCHDYKLESKQQSTEQQRVNSPRKKKFKTQTSVGKVMYATSWDRKGEILLDFAEPRQTINSNHYIMVLTNLKARTSRVRPQKKTNLLLQHDNARPHPSFKTVDHTANLDWTVLLQPLYSLVWTHSDFHPFKCSATFS